MMKNMVSSNEVSDHEHKHDHTHAHDHVGDTRVTTIMLITATIMLGMKVNPMTTILTKS